eukprot:CAMPEP_0197570456 /NCGR_PEP_ID=MMETSP1320-20131121/40740_1 /TAXON_ID=91990 /ORGANISM="Bolidomonas sp., Strain RCC2347" /LENGTH=133 /DNA_ID=CAMNT_0043132891 /DNA_START=78 /DNA_END=479 /DNA_ORIENTATION=-
MTSYTSNAALYSLALSHVVTTDTYIPVSGCIPFSLIDINTLTASSARFVLQHPSTSIPYVWAFGFTSHMSPYSRRACPTPSPSAAPTQAPMTALKVPTFTLTLPLLPLSSISSRADTALPHSPALQYVPIAAP